MGVIRAGNLETVGLSNAQIVDGGLRFDSGKSHYLNRTPGSAGNRKTWTWSGWVKKNDTSSQQTLFSAGNSGTNRSNILFDSSVNGALRYFNYASSVNVNLISSQVFRDAAGWYHIVVAFDSTQATEANRLKFYVNGVQVTNFSTATYPSPNLDVVINNNLAHSVGRAEQVSPAEHLSGQISNLYFIDGQALDASYFGYTDPLTNTWRPRKLKTTGPNNGTTWSNGSVTTGTNKGNITQIFDGSPGGTGAAPLGIWTDTGAQLTYTFPSTINYNSSVEVFAFKKDTRSNNIIYIALGTSLSGATNYVNSVTTTGSWVTIASGSGSFNAISYQDQGDVGGYDGVRVDGVLLVDGSTSNATFGTNGFYLPLDGNSPIGQDRSGRGNDWTPVNFGGSNTLEKATGALPILNTDGGGKVARVGVRTDTNASSLVLALPLVGISSDFSATIKGSGSNKAITASGGVSGSNAQSVFYGGSYLFDGSDDLLSTPSSTDFDFGTGDYTAEGWVYMTSTGDEYLMSMGTTVGLHWGLNFYSTNLIRAGRTDGAGTFKHEVTYSFSANRWYHIAISRQSGTSRLFLDGVLIDSKADTDNIAPNSIFYFGRYYLGTHFLNGYLQDLRIYKGVAKYTSNFIPASTDPDILPDTPSGVSYSSNVVLAPTNEGAVSLSSDGSGDYLSLSASADFGFSTPSGNSNDFTIEWFKYWTSLSGYQTIWSNNYISSPGLLIQTGNGDGKYRVFVSSGTEIFQETNAATTGKWYHYALVRNGTTYTLYRDGIANGSATSSSAAGSGSDAATIGQGNGGFYENGFISNFHVVKGTALYTTNFIPPTGPINSVANTKLLCCKSRTSATVFDVSPGTITANGDAGATNINPFTVNINTQRGQESGYATWNPLAKGSDCTLSNGNLDVTWGTAGSTTQGTATIGFSSGKWYWETTITASSTSPTNAVLGITTRVFGDSEYPGYSATSWGYRGSDGQKWNNVSGSSYGSSYTIGDVIGVLFDADNGTLTFYKNGISQGQAFSGLTSGPYFPAIGDQSSSQTFSAATNFGQKPFKFPPPAGFQPLALANTPRPTIVRPDKYVGIVTYTGNDGTQSINIGFKPDFVWSKSRNNSTNNLLMDTVRGGNKVLISEVTDSEYTGSYIQSFNTNGYTINSTSSGLNASGYTYVNWAWKAGGNSNTYNINDIGYSTASAAGLTAGTITPSGASVNTKSGFSIITYTGTGSAGSVPHGLGKEPYMIILKTRGVADDWRVYHKFLDSVEPEDYYLMLQSTNARSADQGASFMNDTAPTSTTFSLGTDSAINGNTRTMIAYCWAEIPGFSKFGSYTGNNSTDGPVIITGFRPAFVLIRQARTDATGRDWMIFDNKRSVQYGAGGFNVISTYLYPNYSNAEASAASIDFLSNGFKIRASDSTNNNINSSGQNHIYAAFAETPSFNLYGGQSNAR